jgi:hypothetical protein
LAGKRALDRELGPGVWEPIQQIGAAQLARAKGLGVKAVASRLTESVSRPEAIQRVGLIGPAGAPPTDATSGDTVSGGDRAELARVLNSLGYEPVWIDLERSPDPFFELKAARLDVAVRLGAIQSARFSWALGLLEALQIPYVGSGVSALQRCEDRIECDAMLRHSNLATLPSYRLTRGEEARVEEYQGLFGFPVHLSEARVSTPTAQECSSLQSLQESVKQKLTDVEAVVVVKQLCGARFYASLFNDEVLAVAPQLPEDADLAAVGSTRWLGLVHIARRAVRALGCKGLSLVELLVTREMNEYVVSVEPSPSLAVAGPYVHALRAGGHDLSSVMRRLLSDARLELAESSVAANSQQAEASAEAIHAAGIRAA